MTERYAVILAWAIENRCGSHTHGFVLDQVNLKRAAMGMSPFAIRKSASAMAGAR